ncbi:MAG: SEC-C domain-containing protein [Oscillospiraceae bacterium]|jgi:hypothetical protein|nr:SEC-C domain-containing protein [Oscillospiraceae bacterium]
MEEKLVDDATTKRFATLEDCLGAQLLNDLRGIAVSYGMRWRDADAQEKPELLAWLTQQIPARLEETVLHLSEYARAYFYQLIAQGGAAPESREYFGANFALYRTGLLGAYEDEDGQKIAYIPEDICALWAGIDQSGHEATLARNDLLMETAKAVVNLYGICDTTQFMAVFNQYYSPRLRRTECLHYLRVVAFRQDYFDVEFVTGNENQYYILNAFDDDEWDELLELYHDCEEDWYMPPQADLPLYAEEDAKTNSLQLQELLAWAEKIYDLNERDLEELEFTIGYGCQRDEPLHDVLLDLARDGYLNRKNIMSEWIRRLKEVDHNTRKFNLHGHTPAELRRGMPILAEKKVKPNELCPCGSGKKYKKCCGAV